jgi:hypothetical protein
MSFYQYQEEITKAIGNCSTEKLDKFCYEVISRMLSFINFEDISGMSEAEIEVLKNLREEIKKYPVDWTAVSKCLEYFTEIAKQEGDDFREFENDIIEFLSALDSWLIFHETRDRVAVARVSEHLMNILDWNFVDGREPLEKWLSVPEINTEFNKQILFLRNSSQNSVKSNDF